MGPLGVSWESVRIRSWGLLEAVLGESWKRSWGVPSGVSWGVLRASWGRSSGLLGRLGDLLGESPGVSWGSWRGPQGVLEVLGSPDGSGDRPGGLIGGTLGRSGESWERFGSVLGGPAGIQGESWKRPGWGFSEGFWGGSWELSFQHCDQATTQSIQPNLPLNPRSFCPRPGEIPETREQVQNFPLKIVSMDPK